MNTSKNGIVLIKGFEGCPKVNGVITAYQDIVKVWTIAWGHTGYVPVKGKNVHSGMTLTDTQGTELLQIDLKKFESKILSFCDSKYLTQNRFDALTSFELNTGAAKSSTIFKLFNQGDMQGAADQLLRWVNAGGKEIPGLVIRRNKERSLFLTDGLGSITNTVSSTVDVSEETIMNIQKWLKNYDSTIISDGVAGKGTRRALAIALQTELNKLGAKLSVDGIVGSKTFQALAAFGLLKIGSSGNLVKVLEGYLFIKNYNPQEFSGSYNADVASAVKEYQKDHILTADGICGIKTWTKIIG
jgi:lysozyme